MRYHDLEPEIITDFHYRAVFVFDPTDLDTTAYNIPVGKQTRVPEHIFYRSCTGIWQTVWMEHVPNTYISGLAIAADMNGKGMYMTSCHCIGMDTDRST